MYFTGVSFLLAPLRRLSAETSAPELGTGHSRATADRWQPARYRRSTGNSVKDLFRRASPAGPQCRADWLLLFSQTIAELPSSSVPARPRPPSTAPRPGLRAV